MAVPVTSGLILNFQSDNIDGMGNTSLMDGHDISQWNDVVETGGNATADNATFAGGKSYLDPASNKSGMPTYVAMTANGAPGVLFTRGLSDSTGGTGDVLGSATGIAGLSQTGFTAFVVGDFNQDGAQRILQFGHIDGNNNRIVGLGNEGYRFNGNSKLYQQNLAVGDTHIATYTMNPSQPYGGAGSNANYRVDGADAMLVSSSNPSASLNLASFNTVVNTGFALGAGQNNSSAVIDSLSGTLYAMLLYNRILTSTEIGQVESFLNQKFVAIPEASAWMLLAAVGGCIGLARRRGGARRGYFT
jgi:hypothetical protein